MEASTGTVEVQRMNHRRLVKVVTLQHHHAFKQSCPPVRTEKGVRANLAGGWG